MSDHLCFCLEYNLTILSLSTLNSHNIAQNPTIMHKSH